VKVFLDLRVEKVESLIAAFEDVQFELETMLTIQFY
jgi:hypothetical protein